MLASDVSIDGGGGGGGFASEIENGAAPGLDWGGDSEQADALASGGLASDEPAGPAWESSPTAYAERMGIDSDYVKDYFQSQFPGALAGENNPGSDYSADQTGEPFANQNMSVWDDSPSDGLQSADQFNGGVVQVPVHSTD